MATKLWKGFAVLTAVSGLAGCAMQLAELPDKAVTTVINAALFPLSTLGLLAYAFDKRLLPGPWWRPFAFVLGAWSVWSIANGAWQMTPKIAASEQSTALVVGLAVGALWAFYAWLGVWRYSQRP